MQYTQEMILRSDSGYCMPYEEKGRDVQMSLGYGKQKHPHTGEPFFHHGVDLKANHYLLSAVATAHERWAEAAETYMLEGKAPSKELQPVFNRPYMVSIR